MAAVLRPADAAAVREAIACAAADGEALEIVGAGTKRALGRPVAGARRLDLSALSGIGLYEPEELVLSAGAATPLADIEAALTERGQQLGFEPADLGPLYGGPGGRATLGGTVAANLSGPRRIKAGAARDHVLGIECVSGRGEAFKSGGRVVKNVTGYDLSKLITGSHGTLAALTKVTIKVVPAPEKVRTLLVVGLGDDEAVAALGRAAGSSLEPSGLAHLPERVARRSSVTYVAGAGGAVTALRLEGTGPSVDHRLEALSQELADLGTTEELHRSNSAALWREVRDVLPFTDAAVAHRAVWRLSLAPAAGARAAAHVLDRVDGEAYYDWAGGLIWIALEAGADGGCETVRAAIAESGGHATLVRADASTRTRVPVFQPQAEALAELTRRVKESFDPLRILNPGRMYADL